MRITRQNSSPAQNTRSRDSIPTLGSKRKSYKEVDSEEELDSSPELIQAGSSSIAKKQRTAARSVIQSQEGTDPTSSQRQISQSQSTDRAGEGASQQEPKWKESIGKWVWAKYTDRNQHSAMHGQYFAAKVISCAQGEVRIQWADGTPDEEPMSPKFVLRELDLAELKVIFDGPANPGTRGSLKQVDSLLKNGVLPLGRQNDMPVQRKDSGEAVFPGFVPPAGTNNWDTVALPWISKSDNAFDPADIAGHLKGQLLGAKPKSLAYDEEAPGLPAFGSCVVALLKTMQQFQRGSFIEQKLHVLFDLLPAVLLRRNTRRGKHTQAEVVASRCHYFLQGSWEKLYCDAKKALSSKKGTGPNHRPAFPEDNEVRSHHARVFAATDAARNGNLSKARRILTTAGVSRDPFAVQEMQDKHPSPERELMMPAKEAIQSISAVAQNATEEERLEIERALSRPNFAKIAQSAPANSSADQWGWRMRELLAPLLQNKVMGQLITDVILLPLADGYLPNAYAEIYRGGKLLAISKGAKGGSRPITVGDATRRIVSRALSQVTKSALMEWCQKTYDNCVQFASGTTVGAEKFLAAILLSLGGETAPNVDQDQLEEDPLVLIMLDTKNAFNTIDRQVFVDVLMHNLSQDYGDLTQDNLPSPPHLFKLHMPMIAAYYGESGRLAFNAADGTFHTIKSQTGVHQGCVLGGQLFNIGTLPVVGSVMAKHPECLASLWSDNTVITGRLSKAYKAAVDINQALRKIGLEQQPRDSAVYIPSYNKAVAPPQLLLTLQEQHPEVVIPWAKEGVKCLGFPVGNDNFTKEVMQSLASSIEEELPLLQHLDDGLVHFQILSMCTNARMTYFLRGISHETTMPFVKQVDQAIWKAFGKFGGLPEGFTEGDEYQDAHIQFRLPIGAGGMGVIPGEVKAAAAFYVGMSIAFQWAASAKFSPIGNLLRSAAFQESSLYKSYDSARTELLVHGALSADSDEIESEENKDKPVLPLFKSLVVRDPDQELDPSIKAQTNIIPYQRKLCRFIHTHTPHLKVSALSLNASTRVSHLATRKIDAYDPLSQLNRAHSFKNKSSLKHSPLQFLTSISSLHEPFRKEQWSVFMAYILGLPQPECLHPRKPNGDLYPCHCQAGPIPDPLGHHKMNCKNSGKKTAHDLLDDCVQKLARTAGVDYTNNKDMVPSHDDSNKKADAFLSLTRDAWPQVLDFTMVHPYTSNGNWNYEAINQRHKGKMDKHNHAYERQGMSFIPCVATTYGALGEDFVRVLYVLAKRQAEIIIKYHRPDSNFDQMTGVCFSAIKAKVGAATARGMAMRALSCDKLGLRRMKPVVYNVFPGFVDQDLHVLGGHGVRGACNHDCV